MTFSACPLPATEIIGAPVTHAECLVNAPVQRVELRFDLSNRLKSNHQTQYVAALNDAHSPRRVAS
jgi:hypothetical protein